MRHASLFSGIGGFELAADWLGWQNVLSCEYMPFPAAVLKHYYPFTQHYGDIRQLDGTQYRGKVDVLTGGFPCQPFSAAGKRKGVDDNRFLWPEMLRVISEIQPTWVVAENVRGIVSIDGGLVFERVHTELEANGYEVQTFCIPACAVGAPHKRERMWFIAHSKSKQTRGIQQPGVFGDIGDESKSVTTDTTGDRRKWGGEGVTNKKGHAPRPVENGELEGGFEGSHSDASDPKSMRWDNGASTNKGETPSYEHTFGNKDGVRGGWDETWLQAATRLCRVDDEFPRGLDGQALWSVYPNKRGKPTLSTWRRESLKAYGNAIVPAVAFQIFKAIESAENG